MQNIFLKDHSYIMYVVYQEDCCIVKHSFKTTAVFYNMLRGLPAALQNIFFEDDSSVGFKE